MWWLFCIECFYRCNFLFLEFFLFAANLFYRFWPNANSLTIRIAHGTMQFIGWILLVVGVYAAGASKDYAAAANPGHPARHFVTVHSWVGLTVLIVMTLQVYISFSHIKWSSLYSYPAPRLGSPPHPPPHSLPHLTIRLVFSPSKTVQKTIRTWRPRRFREKTDFEMAGTLSIDWLIGCAEECHRTDKLIDRLIAWLVP